MSGSQNFENTSNFIITKLLEVDSELAVQEAELLLQLESVQEKRQSLHTVISLFAKADTSTIVPVEVAQTSSVGTGAELERVSKNLASSPLENSETFASAKLPTEAVPDTKSTATKNTTLSPTRKDKTTRLPQKTKSTKKALGWQEYLQAEFNNTSLPEAVASVLQHQAERILEIPAIVNAVFRDELPDELRSKVRRQVTNILSEGARKNKWYRGQPGYYSMSRTVAADHLASSGALA